MDRHVCVCAYARAQLCPTLCDPMCCSSLVSSLHRISQSGILEWVAIPTPGDVPNLGVQLLSLVSPALAGGFFTTEPLGKTHGMDTRI